MLFSDIAKGGGHKAEGELLSQGVKCQQRCCPVLQGPGVLLYKTRTDVARSGALPCTEQPPESRQSLPRCHG